MADFPGGVFTPRTTQNLPGISYDPTKTKIGFAEDYSLPAAEIVAIETILGVNPQGTFDTVRAWLDALQAASGSGGGASIASEVPTGTIDDSNVSFSVAHEPAYIVVNGSQYVVGEGQYVSYVSGTITLASPVGVGGFIRSWYGGVDTEVPSGTVDDSNVSFSVAHEPLYIVVNGSTYAQGDGLYTSYSSGTITLAAAVGTGGFIRSYY